METGKCSYTDTDSSLTRFSTGHDVKKCAAYICVFL